MPSVLKTDYSQSKNKRAVQDAIFNLYDGHKFNRVVGLAGPNITDYLQMMNQYGIKTAEIYENDISQLVIQMNRFSPVMKSEIIFSDIIAAKPNQPHTLYDLDFCCSINNATEHIKKFSSDDAVITTLSIRPVGFMHTILKYSELIDRKSSPIIEFLGKTSNHLGKFRAYQLTTGSKKFMCYLYKDSAPMVTIQSIIY
jgi:hypothetical protein